MTGKNQRICIMDLSTGERWKLLGHSASLFGFCCVAFGNLISMIEMNKSLPSEAVSPNLNSVNNDNNLYREKKPYFRS